MSGTLLFQAGRRRFDTKLAAAGFCLLAALVAGWDGPQAFADCDNDALQTPPGSFAEMLGLRSIPHVKAWRTLQASGYDRKDGFYDSGNFLRIEPGPRYVLMEAEGPGCIDRMWFTYKGPLGREPYELLIYIDRSDGPVIRTDLDELFSGRHVPFVRPLAGLCGSDTQPGRFSCVPIGFQRSCKVVLVPTAPEDRYNYRVNSDGRKIPHVYYQITFRKFMPGTSVKPFKWDMDKPQADALAAVVSLWNNAGLSPWGHADMKTAHVQTELAPPTRTLLFDIEHAAVIYGLVLSLKDPRNVDLEMFWDGSSEPAVSVPLSPFFGCTESAGPVADVRGLWTGYARGRYYCFLPMPFRRGARILLNSRASEPVAVGAELHYRAEMPCDEDGRFCARRYDYRPPPVGEHYTVLDARGRGHFVGLVMDNPANMEGDDLFFVDGQQQPSIHGTGTEDFFNFAWGLSHTNSLALHGITIQGSGSPVCYRFHLPAAVPFERSLLIKWEHGDDPRKGPNLDQGRCSGVVFYYRAASDAP